MNPETRKHFNEIKSLSHNAHGDFVSTMKKILDYEKPGAVDHILASAVACKLNVHHATAVARRDLLWSSKTPTSIGKLLQEI